MRKGDETFGLAATGFAIDIRRIVVDIIDVLLASMDFSSVVTSRDETSMATF